MPVRFTTPSLGGQSSTGVELHHWQVAVAYRRLTADEWYVGTRVQEGKAPFGQPLLLNITSLDVAVSYGLTSRLGQPAAHESGNLALGLGVKAPTGSNHVRDDFFTTTGTTRYPVDQSIQVGDAGWGVLAETQAFRRLRGDWFTYVSGS
jgi:hypothetical protein